MDSAGVSIIKAFHGPLAKGRYGGRGESLGRYTLCSLFTLSLTSLLHRWPTIISLCAWPLASHQLLRDWCNPLLFMIVWDFWIKI